MFINDFKTKPGRGYQRAQTPKDSSTYFRRKAFALTELLFYLF